MEYLSYICDIFVTPLWYVLLWARVHCIAMEFEKCGKKSLKMAQFSAFMFPSTTILSNTNTMIPLDTNTSILPD